MPPQQNHHPPLFLHRRIGSAIAGFVHTLQKVSIVRLGRLWFDYHGFANDHGSKPSKIPTATMTLMKKIQTNHRLLPLVALCALAGSAHSQVVNQDQTFTADPPVENEYHFSNPAGNTWTIDGNITVGNGTTADSRVFVGVNGASGKLTLHGANGSGDTLLLNGYHPFSPILGRLGHNIGLGDLDIDGGLAVTMGGRKMFFEGSGTNIIHILDGSLNYTTTGFGWTDNLELSFVNHVIGANGSLIVPGVITDAAGFSSWAVSSGTDVELNDVFVTADSGFTLSFSNDGSNTTITAVASPPILIVNEDQTFTADPPVANEYHFTNPAGNTWTIDGNITVGNGATADGRVFVGVNGASGKLTLHGANGNGDALLLNGYHPSSPVLGRLGHQGGLGTMDIDGGLAVTMGGRAMHFDGSGTNTIHIGDGSLNYTTTGFGWVEGAENSFVNHVIGANGSLIVPGVFTDAAGFSSWAVTSGTNVEEGDIFVSAGSGFTLSFADDGVNTTITATPLPPNSYSTWAADNADNQSADFDFDQDGVANGVEFFMGETGSSFTATPPLVTTGGVRTQTWARDPDVTVPFIFQVSENLSGWTDYAPPHANIDTSNPNQVSFTLPDGPTTQFCRLVVTP
jgi:hypothetical protein